MYVRYTDNSMGKEYSTNGNNLILNVQNLQQLDFKYTE